MEVNSLWPNDATMSDIFVNTDKGKGLKPVQCQAIIWTNDSLLLITLTLYMVLPLFATRFTDYTESIWVYFIQSLHF